ncbi:hypothetical protein H2248_008774 [Termitomyces sp. 'cryptogamus']|nr:hypothetical protein H2248_008774 [Termitomyces sp. 'cryptogamus']
MLAISNSCSSSSTSLFSSGLSSSSSQTDYSPPQSPTQHLEKPSVYPKHRTISTPCDSPLSVGDATPRQPSYKRITNLFDVSHDIGYDSEREDHDVSESSLKNVRRTCKDGPKSRRHGLRRVHPALPEDIPEELEPRIDTSTICPLQPQILPITDLDSPSPILLPSPIYRSGMEIHQLRCKDEEVTSSSDNYQGSDLADRDYPSRRGNIDWAEANTSDSDSEKVDIWNSCDLSSIPKAKKAISGIGLGLPSVLCRPHVLKEGNQRLVSIDVSLQQNQIPEESSYCCLQHPTRRLEIFEGSNDCYVQESFSTRAGLGIITGARRFLKTHQYPRRRLYDIPEHISPRFGCKTMAISKSRSSRSTLSPAVSGLSKLKRLHSPLLNACKKPLQWFTSRSPTTGRRTSPVIIHDDVQQTLNLVPHCGASSSKATALF